MLIKKMICEVDAANAEAFAKAQSQWGALSHVNGFIKQAGGWQKTIDGPLTAEIISVWRAEPHMTILWRTSMTASIKNFCEKTLNIIEGLFCVPDMFFIPE